MQILIEGLALAAFQTIHQTARDPMLRDIVGLVMRDEGRHVAFGVNYLEDWIRALPQDQIEERAQFAYEACVVMRNRLVSTNVAQPRRRRSRGAPAQQGPLRRPGKAPPLR